MILYIKRSIKFDLFSISGRFRKKSSDWNRKVTVEIKSLRQSSEAFY